MNRSLRSRLDRLAGQKQGAPQVAYLEYDSLQVLGEEAIKKAFEAGYLEPGCALMVLPKTLTPEQWESMIPIWHECLRTGSKWDEVPYWAGGGALMPNQLFDDGKTNA